MGKIMRISILYVFLLIALTGCASKSENINEEQNEKNTKIVLTNKKKKSWITKEVSISSYTVEDMVKEIFELLQNGIEDDVETVSTVPSNIKLLEVIIEEPNLIRSEERV